MRLYNQTNSPVAWDDGDFRYTWEAFGFCDVADRAVPHIKSQQVPVDVTPVSPENRARTEAEAAQTAALNSDTRKLQLDLAAARADRDAAKQEAERVKIQNAALDAAAAKSAMLANDATAKLTDAVNERDALKAELAGLAASGVAEADAVATKLKAQLTEAQALLGVVRGNEETAKLAERNALAKAAGSEAAALEALAKVDALQQEVAALKKELKTRAADAVDPKKSKK